MAKFSEVLTIINGKNHRKVENPNGKYPIYGSGGIMGYADDYICEGDTVIIGRKGNINNPIFVEIPFWNVDTAFGLRAKTEVLLPKYLYYFCESFDFERLNTTVTIPSLTKANLLNIDIILPLLDKQQQVIDQLDKINALILLRKQQLAKLDELVKSRFIEMFGDVQMNPKHWSMQPIGSLLKSCESGWSGNGVQRKRKQGEIAVLKVSAITKGYFIPTECKVLDNQTEIKKYVYPENEDLLFSRAHTRELVGATALITGDYPELILPDKIWKIKFVDIANVFYMKYVLSTPTIRSKFSEASTGTSGSMYNVSMNKFKSVIVPLPPLERQQQFADFVQVTDKSKRAIQKSLEKLEILKKSLMQEYFG